FERHNDYCGGGAFLRIHLWAESPPLPQTGLPQRPSIYDCVLTLEAARGAARLFCWPGRGVCGGLPVDRRPAARPLTAALRMLRYETKYFGRDLETFARDHVVKVQRGNHTAASRLIVSGGRIALTQEFREGDFCCKSAVAVAILGKRAFARLVNE